jgi:hypothetical protein
MQVTFKNDRTAAVVEVARRAAGAGKYQRAIDLLAEADSLEAWAFADTGSESRTAIAATIRRIRQAERNAAEAG